MHCRGPIYNSTYLHFFEFCFCKKVGTRRWNGIQNCLRACITLTCLQRTWWRLDWSHLARTDFCRKCLGLATRWLAQLFSGWFCRCTETRTALSAARSHLGYGSWWFIQKMTRHLCWSTSACTLAERGWSGSSNHMSRRTSSCLGHVLGSCTPPTSELQCLHHNYFLWFFFRHFREQGHKYLILKKWRSPCFSE